MSQRDPGPGEDGSVTRSRKEDLWGQPYEERTQLPTEEPEQTLWRHGNDETEVK